MHSGCWLKHFYSSGSNRMIWLRFALIVLLSMTGCSTPVMPSVGVGMPVPDFSLSAARGGQFTRADLRGSFVLLSFVDTQARPTQDADSSRSQIVFLKSIQMQYAANGVVVLIVDASDAPRNASYAESVLNFTYDWQLDSIPVLLDEDHNTAGRFGVVHAPTTFLLSDSGVILQRWDQLAGPAQLALSLEPLIGSPSYRVTSVPPN